MVVLGGRPEKLEVKDIEMMKYFIENGTSIKDVVEKWAYLEQPIIAIWKTTKIKCKVLVTSLQLG